jgi:hypothetical protein
MATGCHTEAELLYKECHISSGPRRTRQEQGDAFFGEDKLFSFSIVF